MPMNKLLKTSWEWYYTVHFMQKELKPQKQVKATLSQGHTQGHCESGRARAQFMQAKAIR